MLRKLIIYAFLVFGVGIFACWFCSYFYLLAHSPQALDAASGHVFATQLKQTTVYLSRWEANWIDYGMPMIMLFLGFVGFVGVKWGIFKVRQSELPEMTRRYLNQRK